MSLQLFKTFLTPIHQLIWHVLTTLCVCTNGKVSVVFNRNFFAKRTDFSMLGALQAVTYIVKVAVSKEWCKTDTLLLHTNGKYHVPYRFMPFPVTLDDPEGHSPAAWFSKCNSTNTCATFARFLLTRRVARSLGDSWASRCGMRADRHRKTD